MSQRPPHRRRPPTRSATTQRRRGAPAAPPALSHVDIRRWHCIRGARLPATQVGGCVFARNRTTCTRDTPPRIEQNRQRRKQRAPTWARARKAAARHMRESQHTEEATGAPCMQLGPKRKPQTLHPRRNARARNERQRQGTIHTSTLTQVRPIRPVRRPRHRQATTSMTDNAGAIGAPLPPERRSTTNIAKRTSSHAHAT